MIKSLGGFPLSGFESSFQDLKMEHAVQLSSLMPPLLEFCQWASENSWAVKNSRLELLVRLLVLATGVVSENFSFSSYVMLLRSLAKIVCNLKGIKRVDFRKTGYSREYILFCIERVSRLRHSLIAQVDNAMPWSDPGEREKFSSLPSDCFRYLFKNFLFDPSDLLSLALTNHTFFTLVFDRSLWDQLLYKHSPLDSDYRPLLPIGIVVDNYRVICYIIRFYYERYKRKYVREGPILLKRCLVCKNFFWPFKTPSSYTHNLFCQGAFFLDFTPKNFVAYLGNIV